MFKRNWPLIIAGIVVLCMAVFFYYVYNKSPTYNWSQNYSHTSDSPYGNELLYKVIKNWPRLANLLFTITIIAMINIFGVLAGKILPSNPDLFLDHIVLAEKVS